MKKFAYVVLALAGAFLLATWLQPDFDCGVRSLSCMGDEPKTMTAKVAISLGLAGFVILKTNAIRWPVIAGFISSVVSASVQWHAIYSREDLLVPVAWGFALAGVTLLVAAYSMPSKNDGVRRKFSPKTLLIGVVLTFVGVLSTWFAFNLPGTNQPSYHLTWQPIVMFLLIPTGLATAALGLVIASWGAVRGFKPMSASSRSTGGEL